VLEEIGGFDEAMPAREDLDLYLRLARGCEFASVMRPLARKCYDAGAGRLSENYQARAAGSQRLYEKLLPDFEARPREHAVFLLRWARDLARADQHREARRMLGQAYRLWRKNPRLLTYGPRILLRR